MGRLDGKVAVITGGAAGFGLAMSKLFAAEGAKVVAADINPKMPEIAKEIPGEVIGVVADVSKKEDVENIYKTCAEKFGKLDILCNNAGIGGEMAPMHEMSLDNWHRVFDINVFGYLMMMQGGIKMMLENENGGSIVNTCSIGSFRATPGASAYIASKGANAMMTKQAALEYVNNHIRVNGIAPGTFATDIIKDAPKEFVDFLGSQIPYGRVGKPEEMAKLALFLASDDSEYITGQVYIIDGGRAAV